MRRRRGTLGEYSAYLPAPVAANPVNNGSPPQMPAPGLASPPGPSPPEDISWYQQSSGGAVGKDSQKQQQQKQQGFTFSARGGGVEKQDHSHPTWHSRRHSIGIDVAGTLQSVEDDHVRMAAQTSLPTALDSSHLYRRNRMGRNAGSSARKVSPSSASGRPSRAKLVELENSPAMRSAKSRLNLSSSASPTPIALSRSYEFSLDLSSQMDMWLSTAAGKENDTQDKSGADTGEVSSSPKTYAAQSHTDVPLREDGSELTFEEFMNLSKRKSTGSPASHGYKGTSNLLHASKASTEIYGGVEEEVRQRKDGVARGSGSSVVSQAHAEVEASVQREPEAEQEESPSLSDDRIADDASSAAENSSRRRQPFLRAFWISCRKSSQARCFLTVMLLKKGLKGHGSLPAARCK